MWPKASYWQHFILRDSEVFSGMELCGKGSSFSCEVCSFSWPSCLYEVGICLNQRSKTDQRQLMPRFGERQISDHIIEASVLPENGPGLLVRWAKSFPLILKPIWVAVVTWHQKFIFNVFVFMSFSPSELWTLQSQGLYLSKFSIFIRNVLIHINL